MWQDDLDNDPKNKQTSCETIPPTILIEILGPAYNSRYMSIEIPDDTRETGGIDKFTLYDSKRRPKQIFTTFYVEENFYQELSEKPAWEFEYSGEQETYKMSRTAKRKKRAPDILGNETSFTIISKSKLDHFDENIDDFKRLPRNVDKSRPWECESKIRWIDLGPNYFPRFLRTVECTKQVCWYGHYTCKPKSFTIKLLHRRSGQCAQLPDRLVKRSKLSSLAYQSGELWMWEERAVNFCCDCTIT